MGELKILLANANGQLSDLRPLINEAADEASRYAFPNLEANWNIDLVVTNRVPEMNIAEDGVGGRTYASDFILMNIEPEVFTRAKLAEMTVHELTHAARWGRNPEWADNLFKNIICEGLATYCEAEFAKTQSEKTFFIKTILERSNEQNERIIESLKPDFDKSEYDYGKIFYNGDDNLPRWAGYSAGYYMVKRYLERAEKTIFEIADAPYDDFIDVA